jgi:hypothetical protein
MQVWLLAALHGSCLQSFNVPGVSTSWQGVSDAIQTTFLVVQHRMSSIEA